MIELIDASVVEIAVDHVAGVDEALLLGPDQGNPRLMGQPLGFDPCRIGCLFCFDLVLNPVLAPIEAGLARARALGAPLVDDPLYHRPAPAPLPLGRGQGLQTFCLGAWYNLAQMRSIFSHVPDHSPT
jgi:hypothetical protein